MLLSRAECSFWGNPSEKATWARVASKGPSKRNLSAARKEKKKPAVEKNGKETAFWKKRDTGRGEGGRNLAKKGKR